MLPLYPENIKFPILTLVIITINIVVFIYLTTLSEIQLTQTYCRYGIVPVICFTKGSYHQFLTYGLIHDNFLHLIGNMWLLWLGGSIFETNKSKILYTTLLITSAIITAIVFAVDNHTNAVLIGLSGGVAGIIGFVCLTASNKIKTFILPCFMVDVNVKIIFVIWIILQCLMLAFFPNSQVAFISHIVGFLFGAGIGVLNKPET